MYVSDLVEILKDKFSADVAHLYDMSLFVKKPVLGVSDLVQHKPGCKATEDG